MRKNDYQDSDYVLSWDEKHDAFREKLIRLKLAQPKESLGELEERRERWKLEIAWCNKPTLPPYPFRRIQLLRKEVWKNNLLSC
jgi:hypothetical protein